jgi:hypothetical protein
MRDLASSLTNDTAMIEQDVDDIFNFEKNISLVNKKTIFWFSSVVSHIPKFEDPSKSPAGDAAYPLEIGIPRTHIYICHRRRR